MLLQIIEILKVSKKAHKLTGFQSSETLNSKKLIKIFLFNNHSSIETMGTYLHGYQIFSHVARSIIKFEILARPILQVTDAKLLFTAYLHLIGINESTAQVQ